MQIGDLVYHNAHGVCLVVDHVVQGDSTLVIAAWAGGGVSRTRFSILNESDLIPIALAPQLEKLRGMLMG